VLSQGVGDLEVLVLDDCSPDATREVVAAYLEDERVQYIRHPENLGDKGNNALALKKGRGKYMVWLHGDDYLLPGHLQSYLNVMEAHPECALIYSPCYWVDGNERVLRLARHPGHPDFDYAGGRNEVAELLAWDNYITPSSVMFRQSDLDKVETLDPDIKASDWDLFIRLAIQNPNFAYLNTPSTAYRISANQGSTSFYASTDPLKTHLHVLNLAFSSSAGKRLWEYKEEIGEHLERRVKAYRPEKIEYLVDELKMACDHLGSISAAEAISGMDLQPLVSVVVPTKDRPELLQDTLNSINEQKYRNWEVIVVNDGGVDVEAIVRDLDRYNRFRYIRHESSKGLPTARNTGIRFSRGDILCYLDDDDTFRPQHLSTIVNALAENRASFVYTEAEYIHERVESGTRTEVARSQPCSGIEYSKDRLHIANYIPVNTWAHRRELLLRSGLFDPELNAFEDWDLLIRFSRLVEFVHIPELTVEVHMRSSSGQDHMTQRERKDFPSLYRKIYERYDVGGDAELMCQREKQLENLQADGQDSDPDHSGYLRWIEQHKLEDREFKCLTERMVTSWTFQPSFHFVMTHVSGLEEALADTLDSLGSQIYGGWGLSVVSNAPCPDENFEKFDMLEWLQVDGDVMPAVNSVVAESGADWMALTEAGTKFEPHFLYSCVEHIQRQPDCRLFYMDEDRIGQDGERYDPLFKPEFNLELLRSMPYLGNFPVIKQNDLASLGGYTPALGAAAYDLTFRMVEKFGEGVVGHIADVLMHRQDRFQLARDEQAIAENRRLSLAAHLDRCAIDADVQHGTLFGSYFVDYACREKPQVDIIIPVSGRPEAVELFLDSLLCSTEYPEFRIRLLIREGLELPPALLDRAGAEVNIYSGSEAQWKKVLDMVRGSDTEHVLLMSPGCIAIQPSWLERLVAHMHNDDVAVVAPRLISSDKKVVGGGFILGAGPYSIGMVAYGGLSLEDPGYMGRAQVAQEMSAVSASCMLVRKSVFESVGGVSEDLKIPLYQAVDYCLRVRKAGGKIIWTPHSTLMYLGEDQAALDGVDIDEVVTRESESVCTRALATLASDPGYNPNLKLVGKRFSVDDNFSPPPPHNNDTLHRVVGLGAGSIGSWKFRIQQPLQAMHGEGRANSLILPFSKDLVQLPSMAELERLQADSLLMHNTMHDPYMDAMEAYKRVNQTFVVFGQDDLMYAMPPKNPFSKTIYKDVKKRVRRCLGIADRVIVTTQALAEELRGMADDVRVVPNYLDEAIWGGLQSQRGVSGKPRVGWAGAQQHLGDLEILQEVVRETADEVDWVFFGMCPEFLQPYVKEIHNPVTFGKYPQKLATLNLDLAVAPLEHNRFNESKSNLRLLEYGVLGWPVIASDIVPYREAPVCCVHNQARAWIKAIRERIHDLDATRQEGDVLRDWVRENWLLQQHMHDWLAALDPASDSRQRHSTRSRAAGFSG
jgi:glycosyltransferase involved in cell wall biosynthesis